jgi:predicted DsbA family dithiol-disulfide isomerase
MIESCYDDGPRTVLHWYDIVCPFSYVGQSRTAVLVEAGFDVVALPFQAHPGMPRGGLPMGRGRGLTYAMVEREADAVGLALRWPNRIPDSRRALAAAEWVRRNEPGAFAQVHRALFDAHFVLGQDIDDQVVIDRHAVNAGVDLDALHDAIDDGTAAAAVGQTEWIGGQRGVDGTPAWLVDGSLMIGLRPASDFERRPAVARRCRSARDLAAVTQVR